jgi:hypothetical protein
LFVFFPEQARAERELPVNVTTPRALSSLSSDDPLGFLCETLAPRPPFWRRHFSSPLL